MKFIRSIEKKFISPARVIFFFNEIQNLPGWERWVRALNEKENIKIFITGSSANLMSRELGTLLMGRHVEFHVSSLIFF
ncbi:ATP-binding protein [Coxiella endosymbiont of Ornithodoros amblus]|uniref:ATP-binding protein n=1 Tax=Coxiella endosymbiont of Ornithodoros amblus TaxID=1656166 RepID=UPI003CC76DB9